VAAVNRELRFLARELRPAPRRPSVVAGALGWVFRHLPELLAVAVLVWLWSAIAGAVGQGWAALLFILAAVTLVAVPQTRRALLVMAGCLVTQTRLRTGLIELRLTTHSGRLPLVLWLAPTPVGERVWLWCRAGVSPEDISDETDGLRSACFAREVRVTRDRRWSSLVVLDVVRRDPLAAGRPVSSPLADSPTRATWQKWRTGA
jgi:hypothetical protein